MKKSHLATITLSFMLSVAFLTGCKKGENDPFFSLLSRKARFVANFTLIEGEVIFETIIDGDSEVSHTKYEDGQMKAGARVWTIHHYWIDFEDDHTYTYSYEQTLISENGIQVYDEPTITFSGSGLWTWLGANKEQDIKNKEGVVMRVLSSEQRYSDGTVYTGNDRTGFVDGDVIMLDKLNNFKMRYKIERTHTFSNGDQFKIYQSMHFDRHI